jgi:4-amino-4-deoxy-L-arabinose transferase-like glycosyltransferase
MSLSPASLFVAAFLLRLAFVLALPPTLLGSWDSDSQGHILTARTLVEHGTYGFRSGEPNAFYPPGFIWLISPLAAVFPGDAALIRATRVIQAGLGALVVLWTAILARRAGGERAGTLAGLLAAVSPPLVLYTGTLMGESVFTFVLCAAVMALARICRAGWRGALAAGAIAGCAALVREPALGLVPAALLALPWAVPPGSRVRAGAALVIGWVLVLAPWTLRNGLELGHFAPATFRGPTHLYVSQHIPPDGVWPMDGDVLTRESLERMKSPGEPWGRRAIREMLTNPFEKPGPTARMWWAKLRELWLHPSGLYQLRAHRVLFATYLLAHVSLLCLFGLGVLACAREQRLGPVLFPLLALAYTTLFHVLVTFPLARYFVPMLPFVCVFAGIGLDRTAAFIASQVQGERERAPRPRRSVCGTRSHRAAF